ncbi:MAG: appC [Alphaproteobacteria bacterium]|jgi:peptide/nickel transport system permease protein|nr:appC [Alphaproteobacteria bacterium]
MSRYLPLGFLLALLAVCFSAGAIENALSLAGNEADLGSRFLSPSSTHFLGTDELGRDVFIRLLYGGQVSLLVAIIAGLVAAFIGTTLGMAAGYAGGRWDALLMRFTDMLISLPALPLLIILSALDIGKLGLGDFANAPSASLYKIIAIISLLSWTTVARLARARTLTLKEMDFVRAARALGRTGFKIVLRHIFPNLLGTIVVATALTAGNIILVESVLSFLGLGIQPPLPSWGNMLTNAQETIWEHARLTVYPGAMIFATVLAFNFLGDRLQNRLDPKSRSRI